MTSQNNTLRCAASTRYSMAGPNTPSGAVNAPIEDGSAWLDGIVCSLLVPQPVCEGHDGCHCALARARQRQKPPFAPDGLLSSTHAGIARRFAPESHSPSPRLLRLDLCQVAGKVRRSVRPYRHTLAGPRPNWFSPTSASCRHLRASLLDTRRFRP